MDAGISVADEADLAAIDEWLRKERDETGDGFYCNWGIIVSSFEERELYVLRTDGYPVAFLSDQGATHNIAEVHPEHRGKGYGKRLATHMIALSREHGLSVIEIDCAPSTSVPFWRRMGFTPHLSRLGYGGGIYAHKELPWNFEQGTNRRMPVEINFYPENKGYNPNAAPFRTYREDAEVDHCNYRGARYASIPISLNYMIASSKSLFRESKSTETRSSAQKRETWE
jgi:GNAT superfamily N-acetyltransferase